MVDAGARTAAELAYQRALSALHDAREQLANLAAARRRHAYDRMRMDPAEASARERDLDARFAQVSESVTRLREVAAGLREDVRRLGGGVAEPADVPEPPGVEGFEQPPYSEPPR